MTALSIIISDKLAQESLYIAKQMHISRTQFIRLAIENEIKSYEIKQEQAKMLSSFNALKKHQDYLAEIDELSGLDTNLLDDGENWWVK